jgi:hypothetical protein
MSTMEEPKQQTNKSKGSKNEDKKEKEKKFVLKTPKAN